MTAPPKLCTHCGHAYIRPCDGSNPECENKKHIDAKAKIHAETHATESQDDAATPSETS